MKDENTVDQCTGTWLFRKFCLGCKNSNWAMWGRPKSMNSKTVLQATEENPVSGTQRVSGELALSHSSVVCHLYNLSKSIQNCWILMHIIKILQNFWLTLVICLWNINMPSKPPPDFYQDWILTTFINRYSAIIMLNTFVFIIYNLKNSTFQILFTEQVQKFCWN